MVDPKLVEYIRSALARKMPIEQIRKTLSAKGWADADINAAIKLAGPGQQPQQTVTQPAKQIRQPTVQRRMLPQQIPKRLLTPQSSKKIEKAKTKKNIKTYKNIIFIAAGAFLFILILIILFLALRNAPSKISDEEISQGVSVDLKQGKDVVFNVNAQEHTATLNSISLDSVSITIMSTPIITTLDVGETKKFDFEEDGTYDLSVKLNSITDNKADLYFRQIAEACIENWNCTEWTNCTDGEQTRTCTDLNDCKTEKNKPEEIQECEVEETIYSCAELRGFLCGTSEKCDEIIMNASDDGICCSAECVAIELVECNNDIDCFISKADNCTLSNMTFESDAGNNTWDQTDTYYFEIKGYDDNDKCSVYSKITDAYGNFTSAQWDDFIAEGNTTEEIGQMVEETNDDISSLIGDYGTCNYTDTDDLLSVLDAMDTNGYFNLSESEIETYNCTGNLF